MTKIVLLPTYGPAAPVCSPAGCATGTQYVCPTYWTSLSNNAIWNASTNRWDLFQNTGTYGNDHYWAITATGWELGLRPTSVDFVLNLGSPDFWLFDLFDAAGNPIFSSAVPVGPGLITRNEPTTFFGPTPTNDIGNGTFEPSVGANYALKLGNIGGGTAELVSICFRPV